METRSKKKKKRSDEISPSTISPADPNPSDDLRSWSDLPQDLLLPIFLHLSFSIPDLLAIAAVCRSWRSAASAAASSPFRGPPLLLTPVLSQRRLPRWSGPPRCRLQTLTNPSTYRSMVSSKTLRRRLIGSSHGHLIFDAGDKALLADLFTGDKIRSPKFPPPPPSGPYKFHIGILTAPPSAASCTLLFVASSCTLCWRLDSDVWVREEYLRHGLEIRSLALVKGLAYCLDDHYRVKVVDFNLPASWTTLELQLPHPPSLRGHFGKYLVECDGELLLVLFATPVVRKCQIDVYRLDFTKVMWVKKENLGDWCLFVDVAGNCPVACPNPARWGGRSNCIYVAGPGYDNWSMFPLNGSRIDAWKSALSSSYKDLPRWPSPIWVYPSKLL